MSTRKSKRWSIDPADVDVGWIGSSSTTAHGNFERRLKTTGRVLTLTHRPTGICVEREIPRGAYSKKELQALTDGAFTVGVQELEKRVARHLRLPGC